DRSHGGESVCAAPNSPHNLCTHILAGDQTVARGVSPTGVVVGECVPRGKARSEAVYWSNKSPQSLDLCCGGMIKGANRAGVMVSNGAFVWSAAGGFQDLDPPLSTIGG